MKWVLRPNEPCDQVSWCSASSMCRAAILLTHFKDITTPVQDQPRPADLPASDERRTMSDDMPNESHDGMCSPMLILR